MESFREEKPNEGCSTAPGLQNRHSLYEFHQSIYQHYVLESDNLILNSNSNAGKTPEEQISLPLYLIHTSLYLIHT